MCVLSIHESTPRIGTKDGNWARGIVDALGASVYASRKIAVRRNGVSCCQLRNPQSRRLDRLPASRHRRAGRMVAGRSRRARAKVFPPRRRARAPEEDRRARRAASGCGVRRRTRRRSPSCRPRQRYGGETERPPGLPSHGRRLDLLGMEGRLLRQRGGRPHLLRRALLHAGGADRAPNSPQWFNTGLHWAYGIDGPGQGHWYVDHRDGTPIRPTSAYERPQPHACFIQSVSDDLVSEGGIMDLWVREARLFKYGSGTGSNFSQLRGEGERLSGGGKSSGLMSFLKIGDRAAGAIKSGGTTRRAAKMVWSTSTIPTSRTSSPGRCSRSRRSRRWSPAPGSPTGISTRHGAPAARRRRRRLRSRGRTRGCGARSSPRARPSCRRTTSSGSSSSPARAIATSNSRSSTPIGSRKPMLTVVGPERQQLRARHRRLPARGRGRPRMGADGAHDRQAAEDGERARRCGIASPRRPGTRPIPACSSTRRSTTGTPARSRDASTRPTRARSTCSSTTRRAISPR